MKRFLICYGCGVFPARLFLPLSYRLILGLFCIFVSSCSYHEQKNTGVQTSKDKKKAVCDTLAAGDKCNPAENQKKDGFFYAGTDDLEGLKKVIDDGSFAVNSINSGGETVLIIAAKKGNITMVDYLLTVPDIDISIKNRTGKTAADVASISIRNKILGIETTVEQLNADVPDTIKNQKLENLKALISQGAEVEFRFEIEVGDTFVGYTPLLYAIENKKPDMVDFLLSSGADANATKWLDGNDTLQTALMLAVGSATGTRIVNSLIASGADINRIDDPDSGRSALFYVNDILSNFDVAIQTVRILFLAGADPKIVHKHTVSGAEYLDNVANYIGCTGDLKAIKMGEYLHRLIGCLNGGNPAKACLDAHQPADGKQITDSCK